MFLIRSVAQAHNNRRDESVGVMKEMIAEIAKDPAVKGTRLLTASIGPSDSTVVMEIECETLADFENSLKKANTDGSMAKYEEKFAELMVPGSHRFEVYRIYS